MDNQMTYPEYTGLREAAKILNLSYGMLRKGVNSGRFPAINSGVKFFVSPEQIKAILDEEAIQQQNAKREAAKKLHAGKPFEMRIE